MLRIAGEHASGTILWMADERAIGEHVLPRITKAAAEVGRPSPRIVAGVPVALCPDDEVADAVRGPTRCSGTPSTRPTTSGCSSTATPPTSATCSPPGDEVAVADRLRSFRDAGVTDLAVRVLPLGEDRAARIESHERVIALPRVALPRALSAPVTDTSPGPLAGIRILEVGHILAGPFAGMLLADLGADVVKIEPIDGDLSRQVGSDYVGEHNVYFASLNRNKRSVHVDLTTEEGRAELGVLQRRPTRCS